MWGLCDQRLVRCSPRTAEGHVFVGSDDGCLYAINMTTYQRSWAIKTEGLVRSSPFLTNDLSILALKRMNLSVLFRYRQMALLHQTWSDFITGGGKDGIVYFASQDANFYALDAKSGWVIWRFRMERVRSHASLSENQLFFGSADNYLYCVDKSSSREYWRFKCDHQVSGSPLIYKDSVYCGTTNGSF